MQRRSTRRAEIVTRLAIIGGLIATSLALDGLIGEALPIPRGVSVIIAAALASAALMIVDVAMRLSERDDERDLGEIAGT